MNFNLVFITVLASASILSSSCIDRSKSLNLKDSDTGASSEAGFNKGETGDEESIFPGRILETAITSQSQTYNAGTITKKILGMYGPQAYKNSTYIRLALENNPTTGYPDYAYLCRGACHVFPH